jgi:hypothetical protein
VKGFCHFVDLELTLCATQIAARMEIVAFMLSKFGPQIFGASDIGVAGILIFGQRLATLIALISALFAQGLIIFHVFLA